MCNMEMKFIKQKQILHYGELEESTFGLTIFIL